jgi:HNH endonuclease
MIKRCLFCKQDSSSSRSIEHIVPESLGNTDHVLPAGVVCDKCNNYIARKIEKPLLDSQYFRERRFHAGLPNKKNRIPPMEGIHLQSRTPVQLLKKLDEDGISIGAGPNVNESRWVRSLLQRESGTVIIPIGEKPSDYLVSRFLGKVGLEVLAHRVLDVPSGIEEIINQPELEELRSYVRLGNPKLAWPYSHRPVYSSDFQFIGGNESYEVLHEFDILATPTNEYYIVVAIFGEEYALNLGGPEIEGYEHWLTANDNKSPLYCGKIA